ncbi:MAG: glucokinase [Methyloceanibacter sp.]
MPDRAVVADIGGTNARFAVADLGTLVLSDIHQVRCVEHRTIGEALKDYMGRLSTPPGPASIAVAAPVSDDAVRLTNSDWCFVKDELRRRVGFTHLHVLNDFEALALSLPHLTAHELHRIGGEASAPHGTKLVLGPGTGCGVAALVWSGERFIAVPGEGGHVSLGAENERELALLEHIRQGHERLSAERVLSGPGLAALYQAVAFSRGLAAAPLPPNDVLVRGGNGEDAIAEEALSLFVAWLGRFAGDAALMLGATGGVYIGGGIAPKILPALTAGDFREAFERKGRMRDYLAPIPIYAIHAEFAALTGAAVGLRTALAHSLGPRP